MRFECNFQLDRRLYYEYCAGMDHEYKKIWRGYVLGFAAFFALLMFAYMGASLLASIVFFGIAIGCVLAALFGYRLNAKINFDRLEYLHHGTPAVHVQIMNGSIANDTGLFQSTVLYDKINHIFETKHLLIFVIESAKNGHQSVIVEKKSIRGGSSSEAQQYVREKCKNLHKITAKDIFSNPR